MNIPRGRRIINIPYRHILQDTKNIIKDLTKLSKEKKGGRNSSQP